MLHKLVSKIKDSISAKFLVTFLMLLMIPLILLTQLFMKQLHTVLRNKEQAYIDEKISYAGTQFDRIFSEMDRIAVSLILDYHVTDILSDPAAIPTYDWFTGYKTLNSILGLLNTNSDYRYNITVLGYDDKLYHSGASYNSMLHSTSPIITLIREKNGNPVIFNRNMDGYDDNEVITLGRSVYQKGEYLGSILVELPVSYLDMLLNPFESDATQIYVLENNEKIIYSSVQTQGSIISPALQRALETQESSVILDSTEHLLSQMTAQQSSLSVVTLVMADSVFRESSQVITSFILAFFAVIGTASLGVMVLTLHLTRDIRNLNAAVTRFGNDMDARILLPIRSTDEVGQLTEGFISMSQRIHKLVLKIQEDEHNKRILEFNSLQSQVNPHMIYNTLNTITYLAQVQNVSNIEEITTSFAYLLRALSNQGEFISVAQEIEYLRSFIALKKYNLICEVETDFQVDETALDCRILKLILQPIVENAIIHGFYGRMEEGLLSISISRNDSMLCIEISDNGSGMDEEHLQRILNGEERAENTFLRVGIRNIIDRLNLQYGEKSSFSISSAPKCGTTVHIAFPAELMQTAERSLL